MGELKSAWEIAQEKADRLGKLTVEEEAQQREQRYRQIGTAIAQRYLDNPETLNLTTELNKRPEEEQESVKRAILNHLIQAMDLEKAIQGIVSLEPESQPVIEKITRLLQEYEVAEKKTKQELESNYRETLHQLRVSGTAVGAINVEATPQWQQAQQRLVEALEPRLNSLKQELTKSTKCG